MFPKRVTNISQSMTFNCTLSCIAGCVYVASFYPKFCFWWLTPICIFVLYFSLVRSSSIKSSLVIFFVFCALVMLSASFWIASAIHNFTGASYWPLLVLVWIFFSFVLALFLPGIAVSHILDHTPLAFAATFSISEYLRSRYAVGGTWFSFGYSQTYPSPLGMWAPVVGMNGINFIVIFFSATLYHVIFNTEGRIKRVIIFLVFAGLSYYIKNINWTHPISGLSHNVILVQPNFPVLSAGKYSLSLDKVIHRYKLLMDNYTSADWVVFPEAGIPVTLIGKGDTFWPRFMKEVFHKFKHKPYLISGLHRLDDKGNLYNSMVLVNPEGVVEGVYDKVFLLPLGEYQWPWVRFFLRLHTGSGISNYSEGYADQPTLNLGHESIAGNICYENAFSEYVRNRGELATILLSISNDAWFGRSVAPHVHFQVGQMRSMENGRPTLSVSNSGPTGYIGANGDAELLPMFQSEVLKLKVVGYKGQTPFQKFHGDLGVLVGSILSLLILLLQKIHIKYQIFSFFTRR
ncbi:MULTISPECIES: apolipoprotein N-acyltransferase [Candidatus Ichthyocystis]|uniref:apolipoprotein N-acyltransferase n=1 Tax=Candidatus Ichthyocystis TaxID=2929841 RepID=UPI000B8169BE|nr:MULTISPECIES: apolipoprotein N-acyltransferase [Ichthyocystis]